MDLRKTLFRKDGKGCTIETGISVINDNVVTHFPRAPNIGKVFQDLWTLPPRDDDVWILTYPKTGTHWIYEIVGILLNGILEPLSEYKEETFIELMPDMSGLEARKSPRVINTHARLKYVPPSILEKCKLITMVRNPKATAVSYYHHVHGIHLYDYAGTFEGFYELYKDGLDDLYGNWFLHVKDIWDQLRDKDNALVLYYEEMMKDPLSGIKKIAEFLGVNRDDTFLQEVANLTSFKTMQSKIGKSKDTIHLLDSLWKGNTNCMIRKGVLDDWKNYFTVAQNERFDELYEDRMKMYPELKEKIKFE